MNFASDRVVRPATLGALALALVSTLGGCHGDTNAVPGPLAARTYAELGQSGFADQQPATYRLGANDAIEVRVYGEPDISATHLLIGSEGNISLAIGGEIHAAGLTTAELAQHIRKLLSRSLVDPQVAVNILEYGSQRITVEGSVTKSGVFAVAPGTTLLGALALAGEPDRFGRIQAIAVFRTDATGRSVALFNLHEIRAGRMIDPVLQGNDRVVVGVSAGSRLYTDLLQLVPALALFTRF
jgi:polysaccharide export outer membrane protein